MRTQTRIWFILIVVFIGLGAYLLGRERARIAVIRTYDENETALFLNLYKLAEAGDTNQLQNKLRFLVYASSDYYDRNFSNEVVANESFLKTLAEARAIASIERTQVVLVNPDALIRQINEESHTNSTPQNAPPPNPKAASPIK
jgi:hypothetical protein